MISFEKLSCVTKTICGSARYQNIWRSPYNPLSFFRGLAPFRILTSEDSRNSSAAEHLFSMTEGSGRGRPKYIVLRPVSTASVWTFSWRALQELATPDLQRPCVFDRLYQCVAKDDPAFLFRAATPKNSEIGPACRLGSCSARGGLQTCLQRYSRESST